jgi:uncharacterized protein YndB with AHSA1/START domain
MTERSVTHESFAIERSFDTAPARVFAAWSDPAAKARWFGAESYRLDFRVGGSEVNSGTHEGNVYTYEAQYRDIVPGERIVYTYDMHRDDDRISVSLSTVEFRPEGTGTRMLYTEQVAFFEGADTAALRRHGTEEIFDRLAAELSTTPATT